VLDLSSAVAGVRESVVVAAWEALEASAVPGRLTGQRIRSVGVAGQSLFVGVVGILGTVVVVVVVVVGVVVAGIQSVVVVRRPFVVVAAAVAGSLWFEVAMEAVGQNLFHQMVCLGAG